MRYPSYRVTCLILLLATASFLEAQINTASLSGLATDPTGAAIPHVSVTVTDQATGYARTVQTDAAGAYSMQDLPIGQYTVTVSGSGFQSLNEKLTLAVGQRAREDFHLQVGSAQETVQV
jgi:hypothetical protein